MKFRPIQFVFPAVSAAAALMLSSCASKPQDEKNISTSYREGVPGGTWLESYKIPLTVAAIDPASRTLTLVASDNSRNTFTAGPDFKEFDKLKVGDQVQAAVARELVIFLRQHGLPPEADTSAAKALIKDGDQSGVLKADTVEKTARVTALDRAQGQATLQFADGTTRTVRVRNDVNLYKFEPGEEVVIRTRSAVVLNVENQ
jgi:hypothetical protein